MASFLISRGRSNILSPVTRVRPCLFKGLLSFIDSFRSLRGASRALHDSAAPAGIVSAGDRPAQHAQQGLPAPRYGVCTRCVVDKSGWDADFHARSEERYALHHVLVQARWRGSGNSLRAALAREDFEFAHETGSTVRPPVEYSTPVAKRARIL